uniref:aspartate dehydrogenase n=1 Tax=Agathobacter sp. TaxID=2021311 RepID=UPI004056B516
MFHKKVQKETYDRENQKPVIKSSICTGEKVAGFKDIQTGKFKEVMLIRDNRDMDLFLEKYDISVAEIKTEW